jgi:uncharacterized protein YrrD
MTGEHFARTRRHADRHDASTAAYTGRRVLDEHGLGLGSVTDVVEDADGRTPQYLVVDPGPLRAAHYVPVAGSYSTTDDRIVVAWDKQWVRHAPKAKRHHDLDPHERRRLEIHYTTG